MAKEKKPDNVVFNTEIQKYDAALKPYATNIGAPLIRITDTQEWKNRSANKINHKIQTRFQELKAQYDHMMKEFKDNQLILNARFSFEPVTGEVYHLYQRENGECFLSIIAPDQCNFKTIGSFYLNADHIWEETKGNYV